ELVFAIGLVAGFPRRVAPLERGAVIHMLTRAAAADAGPEIIEHVTVKDATLAGGQADHPYACALVLRQKRRADARIVILGFAREFNGDVARPRVLVPNFGSLVVHGQRHEKFLRCYLRPYIAYCSGLKD